MSHARKNQLRRRLRRRWKHKPGVVPWILAVPGRTVLALFRLLPPHISLGMVERLGRLLWRSQKRRRIGRDHLAQAFPDLSPAERDRLGRISCGRMVRNLGEGLILSRRVKPEDGLDLADFDPGVREFMEGRRGKGAVFVEGHFGSVEAMAALLGRLGLGCAVTMRFPTNYYLGRDLLKAREGWGVELLERKGSVRRMYRRLQEGRSVLLIADQNAHHRPIFVPWFGRLAASERAAAYLALKLGKPLVVSWCLPRPADFRWQFGCKVVLEEDEPRKAVSEEQLVEVTARMHAALEEVIRLHPEQYLWIHNRYRTRPPSELRPELQARA